MFNTNSINSEKLAYLREKTELIILSLAVFSIPLSTSLRSIFFPIAAIVILISPKLKDRLAFILRQPVIIFSLLLIGLILVASFWSPASFIDKKAVISKMTKLFYLPILCIGFYNTKNRIWALNAFLAAMFITFVVLCYRYFFSSEFTASELFHDHIITGFMFSIAAWLSAFFIQRSKGKWKALYLFLTIAFSFQILIINTSRTGHIIYFALAAYFLMQHLGWKQLKLVLFVLPLLIVVGYFSNSVHTKMNSIIEQVKMYQQGKKNTSIGYRIQFHQYAKTLFEQKPILGHGTGSFAWNFREDNPIPSWGPRLFEPHSQYWLIAAELGVIGLSFLICLYFSLIILAYRVRFMKVPLMLCLIAFYLSNLSDSFLLYSATGYLFICFSALALAEFASYRELNLAFDKKERHSAQGCINAC